jgi:hypothetical protein
VGFYVYRLSQYKGACFCAVSSNEATSQNLSAATQPEGMFYSFLEERGNIKRPLGLIFRKMAELIIALHYLSDRK